jgi:hypothetical protein
MLPGYDYDFEMTIRPDEEFSRSVKRELVESFLEQLPGFNRNGDNAFVFNSPFDRWMDIAVEFRRWDGKVGERVDATELANCISLRIPASVRGPEKEKDYFVLAFAIADHFGWLLYDDTDSGCCLGRDWLERNFPTKQAPRPWWKLW